MTAIDPHVAPAEAARRARWFRRYAAIAQSPEDRAERTRTAELYQARAELLRPDEANGRSNVVEMRRGAK